VSDDDKFNIHIDGKAIYKAVKNLLENDREFKAKVKEEVAKQLIDSNTVKAIVEEFVKDTIDSAKFHIEVGNLVKQEVKLSAPSLMEKEFDNAFRRSTVNFVKSLLKGR
jgi:hypothetical protein